MSQVIVHLRRMPAREQAAGRLSTIQRTLVRLYKDAITRRALASLDDRALSDIGISRAQAQFESERAVWELVPFLHR